MIMVSGDVNAVWEYGREHAWRAARERIDALPRSEQPLFIHLLDHVDSARNPVNALQGLVDRYENVAERDPDLDHVLRFIEDDVIDVFHVLESSVAELVPGLERWQAAADPCEADGDASLFDRYLRVLVLASVAPGVPGDVREVVQGVGVALREWYRGLHPWLDRLEASVFAPRFAEEPDDTTAPASSEKSAE